MYIIIKVLRITDLTRSGLCKNWEKRRVYERNMRIISFIRIGDRSFYLSEYFPFRNRRDYPTFPWGKYLWERRLSIGRRKGIRSTSILWTSAPVDGVIILRNGPVRSDVVSSCILLRRRILSLLGFPLPGSTSTL